MNKSYGTLDRETRFESVVVQTPYGEMKFCALTDICREKHYSRGLCRAHWQRLRDGRELGIIWAYQAYPECELEGCPRRAQAKRGGLCITHYKHQLQGLPLEEIRSWNGNFTATGRECKICGEDKPLSEYYLRNQAKGHQSKATQCKECYRLDIAYYQGKRNTKADGTDPLNYREHPEVAQARYEANLEANRERARRNAKK